MGEKTIAIDMYGINRFYLDPSLIMGKAEYNRHIKAQQKEALDRKHHKYYEKVNAIIDFANVNRDRLVVKGGTDLLGRLIAQLFDRTVNSIKKIKLIDSEEWDVIDNFISHIEKEVAKVVKINQKILEYYDSASFRKIKETCEVLMCSQREFNQYITEKCNQFPNYLAQN